MSTPLKGPVKVDGPARDKKMRGLYAFFKAVGIGLKRVFETPILSVRSGPMTASFKSTPTRFLSGLYDFLTLRDISENYMFSAASIVVRSAGGNYLLLQLNCARPASFGFFGTPEGSGKSLWFINENDNLAVPMQPKRLNGVKPDNFGSSGLRPANTNGHINNQPE